jgi:pre-mRNA-processing factor 6
MVDRHLDARRKSRREKKLKQELEKMRAERPTIAAQFADLKRNLASISAEDWEKIPEIGERIDTMKKKGSIKTQNKC